MSTLNNPLSVLFPLFDKPEAMNRANYLISSFSRLLFRKEIRENPLETSLEFEQKIFLLCEEFELDNFDCLKAFVGLDRLIMRKLDKSVQARFNTNINIKSISSNPMDKHFTTFLNHNTLFRIYTSTDFDTQHFLEDNIHLLPVSTKRYVNVKKAQRDNKSKFDTLANNFQKNAFIHSLEDKLDYEYLNNTMIHFANNRNQMTKLFSLLYFYDAITLKYTYDISGYEFTSLNKRCISRLTLALKVFVRKGVGIEGNKKFEDFLDLLNQKNLVEKILKKSDLEELNNILLEKLKFNDQIIITN